MQVEDIPYFLDPLRYSSRRCRQRKSRRSHDPADAETYFDRVMERRFRDREARRPRQASRSGAVPSEEYLDNTASLRMAPNRGRDPDSDDPDQDPIWERIQRGELSQWETLGAMAILLGCVLAFKMSYSRNYYGVWKARGVARASAVSRVTAATLSGWIYLFVWLCSRLMSGR